MGGNINNLCLNCMEYTLGEDGVCSSCGADLNHTAFQPHHLLPRTVLNGKYLTSSVLGEGGFGITYLGWDINLEIRVAIKEYYPFGAVTRNTTVNDKVTVISGNAGKIFVQGRERFLDEARRLAKFHTLPGIVTVKDFFLENGTAYIVMEFVEGVTLKEYLQQQGGQISESTALKLMKPLIRSLADVHKTGVIHRDISPDNIMLLPNGQLQLIDFGAARDFDSSDKSLSVFLKPGYAPEEQYRSRGNQGPWTDVYALSATLFHAIEGTKPLESMERMFEDSFSGFTVPVTPRVSEALMKGLAVRQADRWQSMEELYLALYGEVIAPQREPVPSPYQRQPAVQSAIPQQELPQTLLNPIASSLTIDNPETTSVLPADQAHSMPLWKETREQDKSKRQARPWPIVIVAGVVVLAISIVASIVSNLGAEQKTDGSDQAGKAVTAARENTSFVVRQASVEKGELFSFVCEDGRELWGGTYEGEYNANGLANGQGTWSIWMLDSVDIWIQYEGAWQNGKPNGQGQLLISYYAEEKDGKRVSASDCTAEAFTGEFRDGLLNGEINVERHWADSNTHLYKINVSMGQIPNGTRAISRTPDQTSWTIPQDRVFAVLPWGLSIGTPKVRAENKPVR